MRIALALTALLALAGCKKTLHWKVFEDGLRAEFRVDKATCPETPVEPGLVFRCQLSDRGREMGEVEIKLVDTTGRIEYRSVD